MQKSSIEERTLFALEKVSQSINSFTQRVEFLYQDWKSPVQTMAEQMEPQWKEQREEERIEKQLDLLKKQNTILLRTVVIAVVGVVITALVGVADIVLRIGFNKTGNVINQLF